jgi:putative transcriptional regulator
MDFSSSLRAGALLVASPELQDAHFKRSVVLLAQYSEEGAMGYVLNRPLEATLSEIAPEFVGFDAPLYWGGPCQNDTLHCVHTARACVENSETITDGVFWGGVFEAIQQTIISGAAQMEDFRFFVGYAGWGERQLEKELEEGSWFVSEHASKTIFTASPKNMWMRACQSLGGQYRFLALTPEHPSLN